ncbi:hypothetical protein ABMA28_006996 [Loxostege sticticalis]|uniref:Histone-lysine N-methyltransferase SETMAR n=1 Tax=Loxostege sticticalis TaxID=481309 RepID=A0ABD0TP74_LOXSC
MYYVLTLYLNDKKCKNATQAEKKNCDVYGPSARFQSGNFDVKDASRSGLEQDRHISSYDVAEELGIGHKTVLAHLKKTGYTKMFDIWVPHELTERNLMNRVLICDSLLGRNETEPFLKKLITGD